MQIWVESQTNLWMETNVGWLLTFSITACSSGSQFLKFKNQAGFYFS